MEVLEDFKMELESLYPSPITKFWFHQDEASSHTSNMFREWLKKNFGKRVISLKADFEWAPHSQDLSPPDLFLWSYLKDRLYAS